MVARLRFATEDSARILLLVERHDTPLGDNEKLVRRSLSRIGEARFRDLLAIKKGDAAGQGTSRDYVAQLFETEALLNRVLAQEQCFPLRPLAVNAAALKALGLRGRPGGARVPLCVRPVGLRGEPVAHGHQGSAFVRV